MEPLKQCPFPHRIDIVDPRVRGSGGWWHVECPDCDARGPRCIDEDSAIAAWNRRVLVPRETVLAAMAAAWGFDDDKQHQWVRRRVEELLDGAASVDDPQFGECSRRVLRVARELGFPGAKVPT